MILGIEFVPTIRLGEILVALSYWAGWCWIMWAIRHR